MGKEKRQTALDKKYVPLYRQVECPVLA